MTSHTSTTRAATAHPAGLTNDGVTRLSADDLMSLVPATGCPPLNVGAVLMIDVGDGLDPTRLLETIADRLPAVPRLRQRLLRVPFGCGRPVWVDDPGFRIEAHLAAVSCRGPFSVDAVMEIAAELLTTPLPRDRPLWAA